MPAGMRELGMRFDPVLLGDKEEVVSAEETVGG